LPINRRLACLFACLAAVSPQFAAADPKTVCTITVNSPNEKQTFARHLPPDDYRFVELVERGRPDWLASACTTGINSHALIISGHFDRVTRVYTCARRVRCTSWSASRAVNPAPDCFRS